MSCVSRFVNNAVELLSAAENVSRSGQTTSDMTILISPEGRIQMMADSDWPLDSLQAYHGASTAYRVTRQDDKIRIDGREGGRTCRFESDEPQRAARLLLGSNAGAFIEYRANTAQFPAHYPAGLLANPAF